MVEKFYICPVCSAFFDDEEEVHCLKCHHHYPPEDGKCHKCGADKSQLVKVVSAKITWKQFHTICKWREANRYRSGVEKGYLPGDVIELGGIPITPDEMVIFSKENEQCTK